MPSRIMLSETIQISSSLFPSTCIAKLCGHIFFGQWGIKSLIRWTRVVPQNAALPMKENNAKWPFPRLEISPTISADDFLEQSSCLARGCERLNCSDPFQGAFDNEGPSHFLRSLRRRNFRVWPRLWKCVFVNLHVSPHPIANCHLVPWP